MLSPTQYMRLSSTYLAKSISSMTRNESLRKMLSKLGFNVYPCGAPNRTSSKELYELFVLVLRMTR